MYCCTNKCENKAVFFYDFGGYIGCDGYAPLQYFICEQCLRSHRRLNATLKQISGEGKCVADISFATTPRISTFQELWIAMITREQEVEE